MSLLNLGGTCSPVGTFETTPCTTHPHWPWQRQMTVEIEDAQLHAKQELDAVICTRLVLD